MNIQYHLLLLKLAKIGKYSDCKIVDTELKRLINDKIVESSKIKIVVYSPFSVGHFSMLLP